MRIAGGQWHEDIAPHEARRGSALAEHALALATQQRMLLVIAARSAAPLARALAQLALAEGAEGGSGVEAAAAAAGAAAPPVARARGARRDARDSLAAALSRAADAGVRVGAARGLLRSLARTMAGEALRDGDGGAESSTSAGAALALENALDEAVLLGVLPTTTTAEGAPLEAAAIPPVLIARMRDVEAARVASADVDAALRAARDALRAVLRATAEEDEGEEGAAAAAPGFVLAPARWCADAAAACESAAARADALAAALRAEGEDAATRIAAPLLLP
jgi:hypothetical protein